MASEVEETLKRLVAHKVILCKPATAVVWIRIRIQIGSGFIRDK